MIDRGYFKEGIDLIIEYQKKLKRGGNWLPDPSDDNKKFPYDHLLYYITKLISSVEECQDYDFFSDNVRYLWLIFNPNNQHIWVISEFFGEVKILPYPFKTKVSHKKIAEFKHTSDININQEDLASLSGNFIKTISRVIKSDNFQVNEDMVWMHLRLILEKCLILFFISNNFDKYEETILVFHEILSKNNSSFECIISLYLNHLVDNEKYKKALGTVDFLIDNGYFNNITNELNKVKIFLKEKSG